MTKIRVVCFLMAGGLCATRASAQADRPASGGGQPRYIATSPEAQRGQQGGLDLWATIYESYGTQLFTGNKTVTNGQVNNAFTGLSDGLSYVRQSDSRSYSVNASSSHTYYPSVDSQVFNSYSAGADGSTLLGRSTTVRAHESLRYSPFYHLALALFSTGADLGSAIPTLATGTTFALTPRRTLRSDTSVGLTHTLSSKSSLNFDYSLYRVHFLDDNQGLTHQRISGYFGHQLTRHLRTRLGYGYRTAKSAILANQVRTHDINAGLDYSRSLSFSRRTTFGFTTGSTALVSDPLPGSQATVQRTRVNLTGTADLTHSMGRTWAAAALYRRGWRFIEGFPTPLFSDAVTVQIGGSSSRRMSLGASASYVTGTFAASTQRNDSYTGDAWTSYSMGRHVSLYANYVYYNHRFTSASASASGIPRHLERQAVRVGLTFGMQALR